MTFRGVTRRRFSWRSGAIGGLLAAAVVVASSARAEEVLQEASRTFEYPAPAEKRYLRAVVEELFLLGGGFLHYRTQHEANSIDWDLGYDWKSFRGKLDGSAYAFDTNRFDTNYLTHPGAGALYYLAARGNRLSVPESFGYALVSSTLWELFGEFRERMSVNDLWVTPVVGAIIGETTLQLGAFFDRSCATTENRILGSIFAPTKSVHDLVDEVSPRRDRSCDARGRATGGAHGFWLQVSQAAIWDATAPEAAKGETRFRAKGAVRHVDTLRTPGRGWLAFSDGNVASISVDAGLGAVGLRTFETSARLVPAGLHYRDLERGRRGTIVGDELILGFLASVDYSRHRYERPDGLDRLFVVTFPGATLLGFLRGESATLELSVDVGASLAGADAFALTEYRRDHPSAALSSVVRAQGYSHAAGFSVAPRARLSVPGLELELWARSDRLLALRALERMPVRGDRDDVAETRRQLAFSLATGPLPQTPQFVLSGDVEQRSGTIGEVQRTRTELSLSAGVRAPL